MELLEKRMAPCNLLDILFRKMFSKKTLRITFKKHKDNLLIFPGTKLEHLMLPVDIFLTFSIFNICSIRH
jgi:hypothetical protein